MPGQLLELLSLHRGHSANSASIEAKVPAASRSEFSHSSNKNAQESSNVQIVPPALEEDLPEVEVHLSYVNKAGLFEPAHKIQNCKESNISCSNEK